MPSPRCEPTLTSLFNLMKGLVRQAILLFVLVSVGLLLWCHLQDPFVRNWFTFKSASGRSVQCVAVRPRNGLRLPVVLYLHGRGGSPFKSGDQLRQIASVGLVAVGVDYDQEEPEVCERELQVLIGLLRKTPWADCNKICYIGFSRGAEMATRLMFSSTELPPYVLVRISGCLLPEMDNRGIWANQTNASKLKAVHVILVHGQRDQIFPVSDSASVNAFFQQACGAVCLRVIPNLGHNLNPEFGLVIHEVAEYCAVSTAFRSGANLSMASPGSDLNLLILCLLPAAVWSLACVGILLRFFASTELLKPPAGKLSLISFYLALFLTSVATTTIGMYVALQYCYVSDRSAAWAEKYLVDERCRADFDFLISLHCWNGVRLKTLLEHVRLAHYNRALVNWSLDDPTFRQFVLAPEIVPALEGDLRWRRPLWEILYPFIRRELSPNAAAQVVVRCLRERCFLTQLKGFSNSRTETRLYGLVSPREFEKIYVAGMRSVGIPARLNVQGLAEYKCESIWLPAPRPSVEAFLEEASQQ